MTKWTAKLALWLGVAVIALGVGGGVGTFALLSANQATATQFESGTLSLLSWRDMGDTVPGPMFYTTPEEGETISGEPGHHPTGYWAPGDSRTRILHIQNTGSLDGRLTAVSAEKQAGSDELASALQVVVTAPDPYNPAVQEVVASGPLTGFLSGQVPLVYAGTGEQVASYVGDLNELRFTLSLPLTAGNELQNQQLVVTFNVHAEQMSHNP